MIMAPGSEVICFQIASVDMAERTAQTVAAPGPSFKADLLRRWSDKYENFQKHQNF